MNDSTAPEYHLTIHDMATGERPRERLEHYGATTLSTTELLAILLRTGTKGENVLQLAARLLAEFDGLNGLARADMAQLSAYKGMGTAKAAQLLAALEIGRRLSALAPKERPQITSPDDAAKLLMGEMAYLEQEQLRVLLLDTKNRVTATHTLYQGNVNTTVVRVAEVFREGVRSNATALIIAHNHPSGDPSPSPEDVQMTRQIVEAGKLLGIQILDHIVIGQGRYVSLKERGLGFK
jgi:DNA repair protein RadC